MPDVTCPLCAEDLDALLADEQLPSELAGIFEEPDRMAELSDGYEVLLTEAEARALLTYAKSHEIRHLELDLRQELAARLRASEEGERSEALTTVLGGRSLDARHWLAAVSWLCQLLGSVLLLWGLKVVPVASPFTLFVRKPRPEEVEKRPVPAGTTREHPWAVTWGAVLFVGGLALAVVAGVIARR